MFYEDFEILKGDSRYVCKSCGFNKIKGFGSASLRKMKIHVKGVHLGAYKCSLCSKNFTSKDILNSHVKHTHNKESFYTPCSICAKPISLKNRPCHLWSHKNAQEKAAALESSTEAEGGVPPSLLLQQKRHACPKCGKVLSRRQVMFKHRRICELAPESKAQHKCLYCPAKFVYKPPLHAHMNLKHGHKEDVNSPVLRYGCLKCPKRFASMICKREHFSRMHEKKSFQCQICNKGFHLHRMLEGHLQGHPPKEDLIAHCLLCNQKFTCKQSLRQHLKRARHKHEKTGIITTQEKSRGTDGKIRVHVQGVKESVSKEQNKSHKKKVVKEDLSEEFYYQIADSEVDVKAEIMPQLSIHLRRLPGCLVAGKNIRILSDQLVSYKDPDGGTKIVDLDAEVHLDSDEDMSKITLETIKIEEDS